MSCFIPINAVIQMMGFDMILFFIIGLQGSIADQEFTEKLLKVHEIDIVISAVGGATILDQLSLIIAIKNVGTIKVRRK